MGLNFDYQNSLITSDELLEYEHAVSECHHKLEREVNSVESCAGWVNLPSKISEEELKRIKLVAKQVSSNSGIFLIIGVGGSCLGARAVIDALRGLMLKKGSGPRIIYLGNDLSPDYLYEVLSILDTEDVSVNVISKSGNTLETSLAFRFIKEYMEDRYGQSAKHRIFITTDDEKGDLRAISKAYNYPSFSVPSNVGGRYSVLSAVGLFPIAVAGLDIDKIIQGAKISQEEYSRSSIRDNKCYQYSALRHILFNKGKDIEILVSYEPRLEYFQQWFRQLFAESEGKEGKGIFPVGAIYTRDLHSIGQIVEEGKRNIFETTVKVNNTKKNYSISNCDDGLKVVNGLSGKTLKEVNDKALRATIAAHTQGGVPNILIDIDTLDEFHMGQLIYFFEKACAISAYLLGVEPFDQPGVENYKSKLKDVLINE